MRQNLIERFAIPARP